MTKVQRYYPRIRWILGDQLNARRSWYQNEDPDCLHVAAELLQETGCVNHHIQKNSGFFLAMDPSRVFKKGRTSGLLFNS